MIVVVVLAIAVGLVVPMVGDVTTTRLRAAGRMLMADLQFAQIASMAHGDAPRILVMEPADNRYYIATVLDPNTPVTNPVDGLPYLVEFGVGAAAELAGVTLHSDSVGGDDQLGYAGLGELDQLEPAIITLSCDGRSLNITIDADTGEATAGEIE